MPISSSSGVLALLNPRSAPVHAGASVFVVRAVPHKPHTFAGSSITPYIQVDQLASAMSEVVCSVQNLRQKETIMSIIDITVPATDEMQLEESRSQMEQLISDRLGISRVEFLTCLDRGDYSDSEDLEILHLVTLAPFAR